jgi:hypothetical protein
VDSEQRLPNRLRAFSLRKLPIVFGRDVRRAEEFRLKIVVSQKFIDSPESNLSERGRKQVSVNVNEGGRLQHLLHDPLELALRKQLGRQLFAVQIG